MEPSDETPLVDPSLEGVSLSTYARVVAFLAEGIAFDEALAHVHLDAISWNRASAAWGKAIGKSAAKDGELLEAFDRHKQAGHDEVVRPLPPLDVEHAAFARFLRAFMEHAEPMAFLAQHEMTQNDIFRLQRLWLTRLGSEEELQKRMADDWLDTSSPLPTVEPKPARLV